jgi:hypothetical protein
MEMGGTMGFNVEFGSGHMLHTSLVTFPTSQRCGSQMSKVMCVTIGMKYTHEPISHSINKRVPTQYVGGRLLIL